MSGPSSTSSSESESAGGETRGFFLYCLLFLVLFRGALFIDEPVWRDRADIENTTEFLKQAHARDIRVVALGSSRMHSAFDAKTWAARAGLEADQVLNLSINNGQYWDSVHMLDRANGLPESVEVVLVEVAPWNFNRNKVSPIGVRDRYDFPEQFRQQGGIRDRWSVDDPVERLELMADLVWPLYQRRPVGEWIEAFRADRTPVPELSASVHWFPENHRKLRAVRALQADSIVLDHFAHPEVSSFATRNFERLIESLHAQEIPVVLVTIPTRDVYQNLIQSNGERRAFAESIDALVTDRIRDDVFGFTCTRARDCGLDESIFVDYGHLHLEGARAFTGAIFDHVETLAGKR